MIGPDNLLCVAPHLLDQIWPVVSGMIDSAFAELDEPTPDVLGWLKERKGLLWVLADLGRLPRPIFAACTTSIVDGRHGKILRIVACGGGKADWDACLAKIEDYGRSEGCYKAVIDGRRGWGRVLSDYRPVCVSFEKRLIGDGQGRQANHNAESDSKQRVGAVGSGASPAAKSPQTI